MLTIHGKDLNSLSVCQLHHDRARAHQRFFIGKCKEGQFESVKEEVMAHQAALAEQWGQYLPEQLKLVENYVLETADNYIFFAVAENAEAAADIFKSYFE